MGMANNVAMAQDVPIVDYPYGNYLNWQCDSYVPSLIGGQAYRTRLTETIIDGQFIGYTSRAVPFNFSTTGEPTTRTIYGVAVPFEMIQESMPLDVVVDQKQVVDVIGGFARLLKQPDDGAPADAQHVDFDVEGDDILVGILQRVLSREAALAAADLQNERLLLFKGVRPLAGVLLGILHEEVADAQLGLRPFLFSDSHITSFKISELKMECFN